MTAIPPLDGLGLDDLELLGQVFALLAMRCQTHLGAQRWLTEIADRIAAEIHARNQAAEWLLGASVDPGATATAPALSVDPLGLETAELATLHNVLAVPASEPGAAGAWLTRLLRPICVELDRREAAQDDFAADDPRAALDRARFAAMAAEEQARDRASRPAPDLTGIPPWSEVSGG